MTFTDEMKTAFTAYVDGIEEIPDLVALLPEDFRELMEWIKAKRWDEFTDDDYLFFLDYSKYLHELAVSELSRRGIFLSESNNTKH